MAELVYHHDSSGNLIAGSLDALVHGIVAGRQVRAVLQDSIGYIAYNYFSTLRIDQLRGQNLVIAYLPIRPAVDDYGKFAGKYNGYELSVATIDSTGKYIRFDEKDPSVLMHAQYEVRWFLDKA